MTAFTFQTTRSVIVEPGSSGQLGALMADLDCTNVLLVTDSGIMGLGLATAAIDGFSDAGVNLSVFDDVVADPSEEVILSAMSDANARDVDGVVGLGGGSSMFDMSILRDRMVAAFRDMQLDPEQHLRFLPHLSPQKYQSLNALGDIYLDTPGWSGGNTTLEAIYQGLPIVTMRGREMRACVSAGMLALIGAIETVADDDATFVDIAVRLAQNIDWRRSVRQKVIEGRTRLETAVESVRAMEDFFESAVADARKSQ